MASHFRAIGLPVSCQGDVAALINRAMEEDPEPLEVGDGHVYWRWRDASGAELWVSLDAQRNCNGVTPAFAGDGRMRVRLTESHRRPSDSPMEGVWYGWADAADDLADEGGAYPFIFEAPDYLRHIRGPLPRVVDLNLTAFAHELKIFETEAAYYASQSDDQIRYAVESFFPIGAFGESKDSWQARAMFTGRILKVERRTTERFNHPFWWLLVQTLGGVVDVVAEAEMIATMPAIDGIAQGTFWLCGQIRPRDDG